VTALHNSAHGAAHLYSKVSKDVPCHASILEGFGTVVPCATLGSMIWTSHAVSSQVRRNCTGRSLEKHPAGDLL
jgi:hypothetical protein